MKIVFSRNTKAVDRLLDAWMRRDRTTEASVAAIVDAVRKRGDAALREYAKQFDGFEGQLEVSTIEIEEGAARVAPKIRRAIGEAALNIEKVARRQRPRGWTISTRPGVTV